MRAFDLAVARDLPHLLDLLADHPTARPVAGATDFIPFVQAGKWRPDLAVDITGIADLHSSAHRRRLPGDRAAGDPWRAGRLDYGAEPCVGVGPGRRVGCRPANQGPGYGGWEHLHRVTGRGYRPGPAGARCRSGAHLSRRHTPPGARKLSARSRPHCAGPRRDSDRRTVPRFSARRQAARL